MCRKVETPHYPKGDTNGDCQHGLKQCPNPVIVTCHNRLVHCQPPCGKYQMSAQQLQTGRMLATAGRHDVSWGLDSCLKCHREKNPAMMMRAWIKESLGMCQLVPAAKVDRPRGTGISFTRHTAFSSKWQVVNRAAGHPETTPTCFIQRTCAKALDSIVLFPHLLV